MSDEREWNITCSYGCHEWVKGDVLEQSDVFLKGCRNCDASYFCDEREWDRLAPREAKP